jgi:quercetin dioxygenase-like cupin family protein
MPLAVVNLTEATAALEKPFTLQPLARVAQLVLSVFICQGELEWHKHLDEDELFLTHDGQIALDTDRGNVTLLPEELLVVPKGVYHRSRSELRSAVVLIRPLTLTERLNGHRHFYSTDADPPLEKVRLARVTPTLSIPFQPTALAQVEDFELLLTMGRGISDSLTAPDYGALWLAMRGPLRVELSDGDVTELRAGDLTGVPPGARYHLICREPATLLTLLKRDR